MPQLVPFGLKHEQHFEEALKAASYKSRRVMPTVGHLAHMENELLAGIGNWVGQVGDDDGAIRRVASGMPVRYSAARVNMAATAKTILVHTLRCWNPPIHNQWIYHMCVVGALMLVFTCLHVKRVLAHCFVSITSFRGRLSSKTPKHTLTHN